MVSGKYITKPFIQLNDIKKGYIESNVLLLDDDISNDYISRYAFAQSNNLEFDLTIREFYEISQADKCFYTGIVLNNEQKSNYKRTVSRKDFSKGFTTDNSIVVCKMLSKIQHNLDRNGEYSINKALELFCEKHNLDPKKLDY